MLRGSIFHGYSIRQKSGASFQPAPDCLFNLISL